MFGLTGRMFKGMLQEISARGKVSKAHNLHDPHKGADAW